MILKTGTSSRVQKCCQILLWLRSFSVHALWEVQKRSNFLCLKNRELEEAKSTRWNLKKGKSSFLLFFCSFQKPPLVKRSRSVIRSRLSLEETFATHWFHLYHNVKRIEKTCSRFLFCSSRVAEVLDRMHICVLLCKQSNRLRKVASHWFDYHLDAYSSTSSHCSWLFQRQNRSFRKESATSKVNRLERAAVVT